MAGPSGTWVTGPFYPVSPQLPGWGAMLACYKEIVAWEARSSVERWLRVERLRPGWDGPGFPQG